MRERCRHRIPLTPRSRGCLSRSTSSQAPSDSRRRRRAPPARAARSGRSRRTPTWPSSTRRGRTTRRCRCRLRALRHRQGVLTSGEQSTSASSSAPPRSRGLGFDSLRPCVEGYDAEPTSDARASVGRMTREPHRRASSRARARPELGRPRRASSAFREAVEERSGGASARSGASARGARSTRCGSISPTWRPSAPARAASSPASTPSACSSSRQRPPASFVDGEPPGVGHRLARHARGQRGAKRGARGGRRRSRPIPAAQAKRAEQRLARVTRGSTRSISG